MVVVIKDETSPIVPNFNQVSQKDRFVGRVGTLFASRHEDSVRCATSKAITIERQSEWSTLYLRAQGLEPELAGIGQEWTFTTGRGCAAQ